MILEGLIILLSIIIICEYINNNLLKVILLPIGTSYLFYIFSISEIFNTNFSKIFMILSMIALICMPLAMIYLYVNKMFNKED